MHPSSTSEYTLTAPHPVTLQPLHVGYLLQANNTAWVSNFAQVVVELRGTLRVHFVVVMEGLGAGLRVESLDFESRGHTEWVQREAIVQEELQHTTTVSTEQLDQPPTVLPTKRKASAGKKLGAGTRRKSQTKDEPVEPVEAIAASEPSREGIRYAQVQLPTSPVGSFGITEMGMRCLEVRY